MRRPIETRVRVVDLDEPERPEPSLRKTVGSRSTRLFWIALIDFALLALILWLRSL